MRQFSEPHFIGSLKVTLTAVSTDTPIAPSIGFVESTSGRDVCDEATAGRLTRHTIITNTAIERLLTMYFGFIEPVALPAAPIGPPQQRKGYAQSAIN